MTTSAHSIRKVISAGALAPALTVAGSLALARGADAASPPASCIGHEASSISPPGSSSEFSEGMVGLHEELREEFPGVPLGLLYSFAASLHEGSHEACDAALE